MHPRTPRLDDPDRTDPDPTGPDAGAPPAADPMLARTRTRLAAARVVTLFGETTGETCRRVAAELLVHADEDPAAPITLLVDSPGGDVFAGMIVHDVMQAIPAPVRTVALGIAASMGQFLVTSGTPGLRLAMPHTRMLIHQPLSGLQGVAEDIAIQSEQHILTRRILFEAQARHIGRPVAEIAADSDRDRWFTAEQAVAYGLVDAVAGSWRDYLPEPAAPSGSGGQ